MQDISLYQLVKFYVKNWVWILLVTALGVVIGFVYNNYIQVPLYRSSATLLLVSPGEQRASQDVIINNYIQLFKSRRVLEPVIVQQNLNLDYDTLIRSIGATSEKNTEVIKVTISTSDPNISKSLVEGSVESFKTQAKILYGLDNIKLIDGANYPSHPYNVFKGLTLAITGFVGFALALTGLFFVYDYRLLYKTPQKTKKANILKNNFKKYFEHIRQRLGKIFKPKKLLAPNKKEPESQDKKSKLPKKLNKTKKPKQKSRKGN